MSGHTDFSIWIDSSAETLIYKKETKKIIGTFFTSTPVHNSDYLNIKLQGGPTISSDKDNWDDVDWDDLRKRFEESKKV